MNYHILSKIVILSTLISHTITILIIYLLNQKIADFLWSVIYLSTYEATMRKCVNNNVLVIGAWVWCVACSMIIMLWCYYYYAILEYLNVSSRIKWERKPHARDLMQETSLLIEKFWTWWSIKTLTVCCLVMGADGWKGGSLRSCHNHGRSFAHTIR